MQKSLRSIDLDVTVSNLSNPSLDRRLQSMKELRLCIDWMERQEEYERTQKSALSYLSSVVSGSDISPPPPLPVTTPFITQQTLQSPSHLTDFLLTHAIVERAFTAHTSHVEVMRRMDRPLKWLLSHSALTDSHIHTLWSLTISEKHESVEHLLYELLGKLAPALSPHHLTLLLSLIAKLPNTHIDVHTCHLIKKLATALFSHTAQQQTSSSQTTAGGGGDKGGGGGGGGGAGGEAQLVVKGGGGEPDPSDGLELFWRLMQLQPPTSAAADASPDSSEGRGRGADGDAAEVKEEGGAGVTGAGGVPADVQMRAERYFLDLLSSDLAAPLRAVFIDRLVASIVSGVRVSTSMQLLEKIVQTYQVGVVGGGSGEGRGT